jgi:hypothetical protein
MAIEQVGRSWKTNKFYLLMVLCAMGACVLGAFTWHFGNPDGFELAGLSTASRTLTGTTAVVLTCVSLIVPLTSNLYTPKLVRLYVTHPMIVIGLSLLVLTQLLIMATSFFPRGHGIFRFLVLGISISYLVVMTATLPYLYGLSQFLRPSYFVPMLTRQGIQNLRILEKGGPRSANSKFFFETIDVVTNIALTGMNRSDRQLVLLSLNSLHVLLSETLASDQTSKPVWRSGKPFFVPGLAREGQEFLIRERIWPEAYILAQMLKVMEGANKKQHEILGELAGQLVETTRLAFALRRNAIVELHVMAFNTLMRDAIEEKDLRRFQNLSYHYRLLIESLHEDPDRLHNVVQHLVHYGGLAAKFGLPFGMETVIYDLGELVLSVGRNGEPLALQLAEGAPGAFLRHCLGEGGLKAKITWRTLIHLYWEARAESLDQLADLVLRAYLSEEALHREHVLKALGENRELHFEFNDRLMRFAFLSPRAETMARAFALGGPAS